MENWNAETRTGDLDRCGFGQRKSQDQSGQRLQIDRSAKNWPWYVNLLKSKTTTDSLRFNGHFPDGSGLAGTRTSPFRILLELKMIELQLVTTGATRRAKL